MYVYTHTYIHILFSSYKHIIIRTSTRTNIMSSIACDGTIDDPIPEYEVLATVNNDDGQKKYIYLLLVLKIHLESAPLPCQD